MSGTTRFNFVILSPGSPMAKVTILVSMILIAIGVIGYVGTPVGDDSSNAGEVSEVASEQADSQDSGTDKKPKKRSITALIPSFVGLVMLLFGGLALKENFRKHAMHGAATIGLLGFLAGASRVASGLGKAFGDEPPNWRSFGFVTAMTLVCAVFVALCFNSFMEARRERLEKEASSNRS